MDIHTKRNVKGDVITQILLRPDDREELEEELEELIFKKEGILDKIKEYIKNWRLGVKW